MTWADATVLAVGTTLLLGLVGVLVMVMRATR